MPKRMLQGVVVSDKQAKTVVVRVDRRFTHPIYKKTIRRSKNYHAHDENNEFKPGRIIFEIDGVSETIAREALGLAAAKLPIKTRFVARIAE